MWIYFGIFTIVSVFELIINIEIDIISNSSLIHINVPITKWSVYRCVIP